MIFVAGATIFSSAFLLFLVQPLTARRLLPWFGGSPTVWIVSLLFFQAILLAGYLYAHLLTRHLGRRGQVLTHVALLAAAILFLPIGPDAPPDVASRDPTGIILGMLAASLALPLLAVTATNPLLQSWLFSSAREGADRMRIYRLFAVSNLGSLLGLWCYPFLFEPWTSLRTQIELWSILFGLFAALSLWCALDARRSGRSPGTSSRKASVSYATRALWLALPAAGSVMLLSTSNQLTRNVAAVPFLWVLPLSLYLFSFIIAFERDRWYVRSLWVALYLASVIGVLHLLVQREEPDLRLQLVLYSVHLLAACMICHGELARRRPRDSGITTFYLYVAAGGALGGVAVSLLAPEVFRGYWEYPIGIGAVYVLGGLSILFRRDQGAEGLDWARVRIGWAVGGVALVIFLGSYVRSESATATLMRRSFFGVLRVYDHYPGTEDWQRFLWNGPVAHGGQLMAPGNRKKPILYYGPETGIGIALRYDGAPWKSRGRKIGVIGLGTGSLALYARPEDRLRFYEINPDVVDVAREYFHYLDDTAAEVEVVVGDGRLALTRELSDGGTGKFDILVMDAFTGDAIPVHLLTREAFALYEKHLHPEGILAVHVSNLHFDLRPVVRAQAEAIGSVAVLVESDADPERKLYLSDWVLVTRNGAFLQDPMLQSRWTPWRADASFTPDPFVWTDDYSNLFGVLR